jgi:c-di-GMP-related signal transduction protein
MLKTCIPRVVCIAVLLAAPVAFAQQKSSKPVTKEAFAEQMEREMLIGMFALRETCMERSPKEEAAQIDANWKVQTADIPPNTLAYTKTAEFKTKVVERKKEQATETKSEAGAKLLQDMCSRLATMSKN